MTAQTTRTDAEFAAELRAMDAQVVTAEGETRGQLAEAFDAVKNASDWKAPWSAYVHHSAVARILRAVEFFHADRAEVRGIQPITGRVLLVGHGYQAW